MIASVSGKVAVRAADHVVIDAGGVGYRLAVSARTLAEVPKAGREATLHSHLILRDDSLQLYGFAGESERALFMRLISVAGVGPKMALAVLSGSGPDEIGKAIAAGDAKRFQVVPGVGKKTAERIIVELRERIVDDLAAVPSSGGPADARSLARDGLVGLGYDLAEAEAMLEAAANGDGADEPEQLIAAALRASVNGART